MRLVARGVLNDNHDSFVHLTGCFYSGIIIVIYLVQYFTMLGNLGSQRGIRRAPMQMEFISRTEVLGNGMSIHPSIFPPTVYDFALYLFGCAFAFGVALGVTLLGYIQWRSVLTYGSKTIETSQVQVRPFHPSIQRNTTELEAWVVEQAVKRKRDTPFVFPYDVGWRENFR